MDPRLREDDEKLFLVGAARPHEQSAESPQQRLNLSLKLLGRHEVNRSMVNLRRPALRFVQPKLSHIGFRRLIEAIEQHVNELRPFLLGQPQHGLLEDCVIHWAMLALETETDKVKRLGKACWARRRSPVHGHDLPTLNVLSDLLRLSDMSRCHRDQQQSQNQKSQQ